MKIIALISTFSLIISKNANCCYCIDSAIISDSFKNSSLIFNGLILSVRDESPKPERSYYRIYTVQIEKIYKGHYQRKTIEILTGYGDGDCGIEFNIGEKYIIYASIQSLNLSKKNTKTKTYYTNECTRTNRFNENEVAEIKKYKRKHLFWWI